MAKITRDELVEKLKGMPKEDRALFREALSEVEPPEGLSPEEVLSVREMLRAGKEVSKVNKKEKNIFTAIFGE